MGIQESLQEFKKRILEGKKRIWLGLKKMNKLINFSKASLWVCDADI